MAGVAASCRSSQSRVGLGLQAAAATLLILMIMMGGEMVSATSFKVVNRCGKGLGVQVRQNANVPPIGTAGFFLGPGESRTLSPPSGWSGNIGTGTPSLLAEFTINKPAGQDFYDLSAVDGFQLGVGMSITGDGPAVSCSAASSICPSGDVKGSTCVNPNRDDANTNYARNVRAFCPAAFSWSGDNAKNHNTGNGGTFTITFCP